MVDERARRRGEPANARPHRLDLLRVGDLHLVGVVHHLFSHTTASMALRPSSESLVITWCAYLGSYMASSSPRTRRAALRAAAARSFIVNVGAKLRMRGNMASVMPTTRRSDAVSRRHSLNASACAYDVLLWNMVKSSTVSFKLRSLSRWESEQLGEVLGLQRLGAVEDVAVAVVDLEPLRADLELVRHPGSASRRLP
eukprot:6181573-Pleurochrysis_carterae.AAC.2